jgi:hypothetical protein
MVVMVIVVVVVMSVVVAVLVRLAPVVMSVGVSTVAARLGLEG